MDATTDSNANTVSSLLCYKPTLIATVCQVATSVVSVAEMKNWLATTDANLTFIGEPIENLGISPFVTTVTYCSTRAGSLCSGPCTVFTGSNVCLNAPDTNCLSATGNVAFCDHAGCSGSCNNFNSCGTRLDNGFCATPGTKSISVPIS